MNEKIEKNKKVTQSPTWSGICSNKVITRNGLSTSCKRESFGINLLQEQESEITDV